MSESKKAVPKVKKEMHVRNQHKERYNFEVLTSNYEALATFVRPNPYGDLSIDFANPEAVLALNTAILKTHYKLDFWEIPKDFLCPPIPSRADYIHYIADLLADTNNSKIPTGNNITCLDVGVGASCIYPIVGNYEYGWSFIGSDISTTSLKSAKQIATNNKKLTSAVKTRLQQNSRFVFEGIINEQEHIDFTVCNPPFHSSAHEARKASTQKVKNLQGKGSNNPILNFGGQHNELWCEGGELKFIRDMIFESRRFGKQCFWFTTLVSKKENLKPIYRTLKKVEALEVKTIEMSQGNKSSRLVCWTFLSLSEQRKWITERW